MNWFVLSGFRNPWDFFYQLHRPYMFPYPPVMLWILAVPRILFSPMLPGGWETVTPAHLLVMRLPLLACDLALFALLLRLCPAQPRRVLWIYWCSPIVFFINYVHGQLDIVPTALLFGALYLLTRSLYEPMFFLLALAAAAKSHVFIVFPFIVVFLYKKRIRFRRALSCAGIFSAVYGLLLLPYFGSHAFHQMVFHTPEQQLFFSFSIHLSRTLSIAVCPTVVTLLFIKFASYKKLNQEILFMFLGILFASLVLLVPPAPGRFIWSLPLLVYFYLGNREYSRAPFVIFNAVYMVYFGLFYRHELYTPQLHLADRFPAISHLDNLALSVLMASMGFIAFWMYGLGVRRNEELRRSEAPVLIGIAGDSGSGKHTLLRALRTLVGKARSTPVFGDDFHRWERSDEHWQIYSHLNPSANRLHQSADLAVALKDGQSIELGRYDHATGKFTDPKAVEPNHFVFFVGLHPFYLKRMRDMIPIKIFLDTSRELNRYWKVWRDVSRRGHQPADVLEQIEAREPDRAKYIEPQKQFADLIIRYTPAVPLDLNPPAHLRIPLLAEYVLDNSVNLEPLVELLSRVPTLTVEHASNVNEQELRIRGSISAHQIMEAAYALGLNFDELLINARGWLRDHNGVTQLVFLVLYNHRRKM